MTGVYHTQPRVVERYFRKGEKYDGGFPYGASRIAAHTHAVGWNGPRDRINRWLWGMSRLIYTSARTNRLPHWFAHLDSRGLPRRAILLLGIVFVIMTGMTAVFPNLLVSVLTVASSVFLFLYLLCLVSYLRVTQSYGKRLVYAVLFVFLLATLVSIGLKILYPIVVFLLALFTSIVRERRLASHLRKERHKEEREGVPGKREA